MFNSEIPENSQHFPQGFRREFDAHVYYDLKHREEAAALREKAACDFKGKPIFISRLVDHPVGPHPMPMFEIDFPRDLLPEMLHWLMHSRKNLDILVHEVTGNDLVDHFEGAMWLGKSYELDKSRLDPIDHS